MEFRRNVPSIMEAALKDAAEDEHDREPEKTPEKEKKCAESKLVQSPGQRGGVGVSPKPKPKHVGGEAKRSQERVR